MDHFPPKVYILSMTVRDALAEGKTALAYHDTDTPDLDAALLLAHILEMSRAKLYMELGEVLSDESIRRYREDMERRISGEPVAWILGIKEFWGMEYRVGPGVLCPRPDSEVLIEEALAIMDGLSGADHGLESAEQESNMVHRLHDCCTGPGTLALALKKERPHWTVSASDISEPAEMFFNENNRKLCSGKVDFRQADLLDGIAGPFDIIVSNPPYLTPEETDQRKALGWKEPSLALDGGDRDGLALIRRLIPEAKDRLKPGGSLLIEADPLQMPIIKEILLDTGFTAPWVRKDYGKRDRVISARISGGL